jgi:hypothetical protein
MVSAMTKFEDLAANIQALILAKLAMDLNRHRCANLYELAKKQHTDLKGAWRAICRTAGQAPCTIPAGALRPGSSENTITSEK